MTSPYTWVEEFTKKENWLGGFRKGGEPYMTLDALGELLGPHFVMRERRGTWNSCVFAKRGGNSSTRSPN